MLVLEESTDEESLRKKGITVIDTENNSTVLDIKFRNLNLSNKWNFSEIDLNEVLIQSDKRGQIEYFICRDFPGEAKYFSSGTEEFDDYYDLFSLDEFELCSYIVTKLKGGQIKSRITILENSEIDGDLDNPDRTKLFETILKNKNINMLIFGSKGHYGLALFDFDNNKINVVDFDLHSFLKKKTRETSKPELNKEIFGKYSNMINLLNKDSIQGDRCGCCGLIAAVSYIKIYEEYMDNSGIIDFNRLTKDFNIGLFQFKVMGDVEQIIDTRLGLKQLIKFEIDESEKNNYNELRGKDGEHFFILKDIKPDESSICTDIDKLKNNIGRFILSTTLENPENYREEYNSGIINSLINILGSSENYEYLKEETMINFGHLLHSNKRFKNGVNKYLGENKEIAKRLNIELEKCGKKFGLDKVHNFIIDDIPNLTNYPKRVSSLSSKKTRSMFQN